MQALVDDLIDRYGVSGVPAIMDKIKAFGFKYVTKAGITWSLDDVMVPEEKAGIIEAAKKKSTQVNSEFEEGLLSEDESSQHSIQTELTADCLGGAWLGSLQSQNIYEPNEIMEAVDAASAVGDDNIQERTQGTVQPETWTHGSSEQRKQSLMKGYQNFEDPSVCIQR
jgi:DNA-directed RNA polymerase beta' subunit